MAQNALWRSEGHSRSRSRRRCLSPAVPGEAEDLVLAPAGVVGEIEDVLPRGGQVGAEPPPHGLSARVEKIKDAWPDLHYRTVKGALLLSPSPPAIAPSQLRLVE